MTKRAPSEWNVGDKAEVNYAALSASPETSERWQACEVLSINSIGQVYIAPEHGTPLYVWPKHLRRPTGKTYP
jgi:hypothetical protein